MYIASQLAQFVHQLRVEDIPQEVLEKAKTCVLNGYGIALGSHQTPFFAVAQKAVLRMDGERESGATLLGSGLKSTIAGAALANAALFHGRAQEDTCGVAHFGAVLLPLLTAMLERGEGDSTDFLLALICGYEVGGLLETAYSTDTTGFGLRASPLYGTIAAAAAVAKMWRLDVEQVAAAIANAVSMTGGVLQSFSVGTDEWRYQVGMAARNGLAAASLAAQGSVSALNAFEGKSGFISVYARQTNMAGDLLDGLGRDWSIQKVTFKPYPVCALNQTPVRAGLLLRSRIGDRLSELKELTVRLNPTVVGYAGMDHAGPFQSLSGTLMSIQFCVASTLLYGVPTVSRMSAFQDEQTLALIPKIKPVADKNLGLLTCRLEAEFMGSGEQESIQLDTEPKDYSYSRQQVSELIRQIGLETEVDHSAYTLIERFVEDLPQAQVADVLEAFKQIQ